MNLDLEITFYKEKCNNYCDLNSLFLCLIPPPSAGFSKNSLFVDQILKSLLWYDSHCLVLMKWGFQDLIHFRRHTVMDRAFWNFSHQGMVYLCLVPCVVSHVLWCKVSIKIVPF